MVKIPDKQAKFPTLPSADCEMRSAELFHIPHSAFRTRLTVAWAAPDSHRTSFASNANFLATNYTNDTNKMVSEIRVIRVIRG